MTFLNKPITKRQLGVLLIMVGVIAAAALLGYDLLRHHPIGDRVQPLALLGTALIIMLGATLIPLGNRPA